jgi:hypothetical protein
VAGAGRTDAGVHALGQVAAFELEREIEPEALQRALNGLLPKDVARARRGARPGGLPSAKSASPSCTATSSTHGACNRRTAARYAATARPH